MPGQVGQVHCGTRGDRHACAWTGTPDLISCVQWLNSPSLSGVIGVAGLVGT